VKFVSKSVKLHSILVQGASAKVFSGKCKIQGTVRSIVVKWFKMGPSDQHLEKELNFLERVKGLYPNIPKVIGLLDDKVAILLEPIGQHFSTKMDDICLVAYG
jgi:hypothetical protein